MQAIILCAGRGKRISKDIDNIPKSLLQIGNKSILEHQIELLNRYLDREPLIVVGYRQDMIRKVLSDKEVCYVENPEYATTNILTSLWYALNGREIDDGIICLPGDLIFDEEVIKRLLEADSEITIAVQNRPCDDEAVKVLVRGEQVISIGKDLTSDDAFIEFLGIFKAVRQSAEAVRNEVNKLIASGAKGAYIFSVIQGLIDKGKRIGFVDIGKGLWEEIDFIDDYIKAKDKFKGISNIPPSPPEGGRGNKSSQAIARANLWPY